MCNEIIDLFCCRTVLGWVSANSQIVWKGLLTVALVFVAAALTMTVSNAFQGKISAK